MNILITGASGFIGAAITKKLISLHHSVTVIVRDVNYAKTQFPNAKIAKINLSQATTQEYWQSFLKQVDVVINCIGIFNQKQQTLLHTEIPKALFSAANTSKTKLVIQLSALGVDRSSIPYCHSKKVADDYLLTLNMPSVILRPSLVYASGTYGGTSLFRALSALPVFLPIVGNGKQLLQPIYIDELSQAISNLINDPPNHCLILNATGKEQISLLDLLKKTRQWLGFRPAIPLKIPIKIVKLACFIGDKLKSPVINATSFNMLRQDNINTDMEFFKFETAANISIQAFSDKLFSYPSYVQDRWQAKLYFLRPFLRLTIGFTWFFSGLISLVSYKKGLNFLTQIPISNLLHWPLLLGGSLLDMLLGIASLINYRIKLITSLQIFIIIFYTIIISLFLPHLWLDPFGAVLKNLIILVASLILIILSDLR